MNILFGNYHKGQNHWTLVYINLQKEELLYIDPLGPPDENEVAQEMGYKWLEWALIAQHYVPTCCCTCEYSASNSATCITTRWAELRNIYYVCAYSNFFHLQLNSSPYIYMIILSCKPIYIIFHFHSLQRGCFKG